MVDAIRQAAAPLLPVLPHVAWLPHRLVRKSNGKLDKPPAEGATTDNPASWFTLDAALEKLSGWNGVAGIGFAITKGIIGLDFDKCRDPITGELSPTVQVELERCNSYAYVTPSRTGIRIVGLNDPAKPIPGGKFDRFFPDGTKVEVFIGPTNHYNTFCPEVIEGYDVLRDISSETLDYLAGLDRGTKTHEGEAIASGDPSRSIQAIRAALSAIPNHRQDWNEWCRIGMAVWRSSGGSQEGFDAWRDWSAKHNCHDIAACRERWQHWFRSPPTKIGFGSLYAEARRFRPLFVAPNDDQEWIDPETGEVFGGKPDMPGHEAGQAGQDQTQQAKPEKPKRPAILSLDELDALPPPEWLIKDLVPDAGFVVPYGPPKSGKTFIMLAAGLHVAAGVPWCGRAVKQGAVVYIAGEGLGGLSMRIKAMRQHYGITSKIPFYVIPRAVNFQNLDEVVALSKLIRDAAGNVPVRMVFLDTLARSMPGADENSAKEVGVVVAHADWLRDELSCTVLPIHHSGKDAERGARGTSALRGAWDAAFEITGRGKTVNFKVADQKDGESGETIVFDMVDVMVGLRTTLVPVMREGAGQDGTPGHVPPRPTVLSGDYDLAYQTLLHVVGGPDGAILPPLPDLPPDVRGVRAETFRRALYDRMVERSPEAKKKTYQRTVAYLRQYRMIGTKEPWIWLV